MKTWQIVAGLFVAGAGLGAYDALTDPERMCIAIDGDTLNCGGERVRLNGIDAPELPGHCRPGRECVVGDPFASKSTLEAGLEQGPVKIRAIRKDRYGRTIAQVTAGKTDLSCWQIGLGMADYVPRYDSLGLTEKACGVER